jgi:hypothetical protein
MVDDNNTPERPRSEPEIIPPDRGWGQNDGRRSPWNGSPFGQGYTTHRIYMRHFGPIGIALALLAIAAIVAIVMIAVLGAVLIWVPVVAAVLVIAAALRLLRGFGVR